LWQYQYQPIIIYGKELKEMKKRSVSMSAKILCLIVAGLMFIPANSALVFAQEKIVTKIKHKPLKYFVADHRIRVEAAVSDEADINLVRCYFRAPEQADFVFVTMTESEKGNYQGILPVPGPHTDNIIYIFLAANTKKQVVKTQEFLMKKEAKEVPPWQMKAEGDVKVSTELGQAPEKPKGFRDSILMDQSESTVRLSGASLIYQGISWWWVGAGIAAGGGAGLLLDNGGDGNDDNGDKVPPVIKSYPGEINSTDSQIVVEFSEAMSESGKPSSEQWQISSFGWFNNTTFYIQKNNSEPLDAGSTIHFTLTGFNDAAGNALASPDNFSVTVRTTGVKVEW
jgi:hypothetical protein